MLAGPEDQDPEARVLVHRDDEGWLSISHQHISPVTGDWWTECDAGAMLSPAETQALARMLDGGALENAAMIGINITDKLASYTTHKGLRAKAATAIKHLEAILEAIGDE